MVFVSLHDFERCYNILTKGYTPTNKSKHYVFKRISQRMSGSKSLGMLPIAGIKVKTAEEVKEEYQTVGGMQCPLCATVYETVNDFSTWHNALVIGCACGRELCSNELDVWQVKKRGR
jgi:hypothetical protein